MWLINNQLDGAVPPQLGNLAKLTTLQIHSNLLSGPLPVTLTALNLTSFAFYHTDVCEPGDAAFQTWLAGIDYLSRTNMICGTQIVSGTVWDDADRDGVQDAGEPGVAQGLYLWAFVAAPRLDAGLSK